MKKLLMFLVIMLFFLNAAHPVISYSENDNENNDSTILKVSADYYKTIQDAIDNSTNGDTIYVFSGIYYENLVIDKSISLIGENKKTTIIDGSKVESNKTIVKVNSENVKISGFTIQNAKGIDGRAVIFLNSGGLGFTRDNVFTDNIIKHCSYGVMIANPINNIIANNSCYGCGIGPYLSYPLYFENRIYNNTVNDKPQIFYVNEQDLIIDDIQTDSLTLIKCKNVEIKNLNMSNNTVGIDINYCSHIKVSDSIISNTRRGGIYVHHSNFCTFEGNTFINDNWGVFFRKSHFNKIYRNNFINIKMPDWFASSYFNSWNSNYWGEEISGTKKIFGKLGHFENIPWYNYDKNPANETYSYNTHKTFYVDDSGGANFTKIQDAIDMARSGDTIYVYEGTYYEDVVVDKSLRLIGENRENTIINAGDLGDAILLTADNSFLSNFTLCNTKTGFTKKEPDTFYNTGIKVKSDNNTIKNLNCINTNFAMWFLNSDNNKIMNNHLEGFWDGISLDYSDNNFLRDNLMYGSGILTDSFNDIDPSNMINDKPTYYYYNQTAIKVPEDAGQVILVKCNDFVLENLTVNETTLGISVFDSNNNIIRNNIIYNNTDFGIILNNSDNNIIEKNHLYDNPIAISLAAGGLKCYEISSNCENNTIASNNISNNYMGMEIVKTNYNIISKNNFIENLYQIRVYGAKENNIEKNYWDNWIGLKLSSFKQFPKIMPVLVTYKKIFGVIDADVRRIPVGFVFDNNPADEMYEI